MLGDDFVFVLLPAFDAFLASFHALLEAGSHAAPASSSSWSSSWSIGRRGELFVVARGSASPASSRSASSSTGPAVVSGWGRIIGSQVVLVGLVGGLLPGVEVFDGALGAETFEGDDGVEESGDFGGEGLAGVGLRRVGLVVAGGVEGLLDLESCLDLGEFQLGQVGVVFHQVDNASVEALQDGHLAAEAVGVFLSQGGEFFEELGDVCTEELEQLGGGDVSSWSKAGPSSSLSALSVSEAAWSPTAACLCGAKGSSALSGAGPEPGRGDWRARGSRDSWLELVGLVLE